MDTKNLDIVYFVRDGRFNEEFRYSLRSVCKNMPYRRIWVFGGCPKTITPDIRVRVAQKGKTKWDKVRTMFRMAAENKEITDDFILFNDDFFIMKPMGKIVPLYRCSLDEHIEILDKAYKNSSYSGIVKEVRDELKKKVDNPLSYELHVPFVFNKKKLLKLIDKYPDQHCTRTLYGNLYKIGGEKSNDVKVFSLRPPFDYKDSAMLSTEDGVVNVNNDIWRFIKKSFPTRCKYEIDIKSNWR